MSIVFAHANCFVGDVTKDANAPALIRGSGR
jgi:hypothetical protein